MSLPVAAEPYFGSGADAPYDAALRDGGGMLRIIDQDGAGQAHIELARYLSAADVADHSVLARAVGTVLDVGCGPGRMVRAAIVAGHLSLGIDVSPAAVDHAQAQGLPVLHRSVFDTVPREGGWDSVLLLDGNIGIGGAPAALLARCADLVRPGGVVLVETHSDPDRDHGFQATLIDGRGQASLPFPWHEVGVSGLRRHALRAGLAVADSWSSGGRVFLQLRREPGDAAIRYADEQNHADAAG